MNANQYPVTFPYKAQDGYYYGTNGTVGKYHRGNDRPTPTGTRIVIGTQTIGLTGASGIVSGSHLHTQACTAGSNYADDFDPSPFEFKNGTVVKTGWHSQFGNHIVIRVGGVDITYAHLSKIDVQVGQVIGVAMPTRQEVYNQFAKYLGKAYADGLKESDYAYYTSRGWNVLNDTVLNGLKTYTDAEINKIKLQLSEVTKALNIKDDEIKRLNALLAVQSEDTQLLNSFGQVLVKLVQRIGLK